MKSILKWAGIAVAALCLVGLGALLAGGGHPSDDMATKVEQSNDPEPDNPAVSSYEEEEEEEEEPTPV